MQPKSAHATYGAATRQALRRMASTSALRMVSLAARFSIWPMMADTITGLRRPLVESATEVDSSVTVPELVLT